MSGRFRKQPTCLINSLPRMCSDLFTTYSCIGGNSGLLIRADGCAYRWESVTFTRVNLSLVQGYSDDGVDDDDHHGLKSSPLPRLIS